MKKWKCINEKCGGKCKIYTEKVPLNCILDDECAEWEKVTEEHQKQDEPTTNCSQLPRLTTEVFDRPDCPEWANYAAVDECGSVRLFSDSPWLGESCWNWSNGEVKHLFGVTFDASDWQKSRIKRPKKNTLPDWCKVEAICWHKQCGYFEVTMIDDFSSRIDIKQVADKSKGYLSFHTVCNDVCQARLRPYNAEEMKALVGKTLDGKTFCSLIVGYDACTCRVNTAGSEYTRDALLVGYTINGKPCGVLEHLEDGEWKA